MQVSKCLLACLVLVPATITLGAISALPSSFLEGAEPLSGICMFVGSGVPLENQGNLIPDRLYGDDLLDKDRISCMITGLDLKLKTNPNAQLGLCGYLSRYSIAAKLNWKQVVQRRGDNILSLSPGIVFSTADYDPYGLSHAKVLYTQAWGVEIPVIWTYKVPAIADEPNLKARINACAKVTYARNKMTLKEEYWYPGGGLITLDLGTADVFTGSIGVNSQFRGKLFTVTPELVIRLVPIGDNKFKGKPGFGISVAWLSDWSVFK